MGGEYHPWQLFSHSLGFCPFDKTAMLQCIARVGGLAFVGDSTLRAVANQLLTAHLDETPIPNSGVHHDDQKADKEWTVVMPDGSNATARLQFRFVRNAWPSLGQRTEELLLGSGLRTLVAHSAFWDLVFVENGNTDYTFLSKYQRHLATYLAWLRKWLVPRVEKQWPEGGKGKDGSTPLPPLRFVWRLASPVSPRLNSWKATALLQGRIAAFNAFARAALKASGLDWGLLDPFDAMPLDRVEELLDDDDGFHPSNLVNEVLVQVLFNNLCGEAVGPQTLLELAGPGVGMPQPWDVPADRLLHSGIEQPQSFDF